MKFEKDRPIYTQLIEDIEQSIISGKFKSGEKLPSIRGYAEKKVVNPNTVQKAYSELERSGYIFSKRGVGYFVNEDIVEINKFKCKYLELQIDEFINKMSNISFSKEEIIEKIKEKLW